jgi:hypothetical protein
MAYLNICERIKFVGQQYNTIGDFVRHLQIERRRITKSKQFDFRGYIL